MEESLALLLLRIYQKTFDKSLNVTKFKGLCLWPLIHMGSIMLSVHARAHTHMHARIGAGEPFSDQGGNK